MPAARLRQGFPRKTARRTLAHPHETFVEQFEQQRDDHDEVEGAHKSRPYTIGQWRPQHARSADNHAALLRTRRTGAPHVAGAEPVSALCRGHPPDHSLHPCRASGRIDAHRCANPARPLSGNLALCKDVQPLIAKRLAEVSQRLEELRHIQRLLRSFLNQCRAQDQDTLCHVVDALSGAASSCVSTSP